jgi:hypothetical protein
MDFDPFDVTVVVSVGRGADSVSSWRVEDGQVVSLESAPESPALVLTVSPPDAELLKAGELSPAVAYMQGRLKPAGDTGLWLRLAKFSTTPDYDNWRKSVLSS